MPDNASILPREHHFYVALAKHVFVHQERGIVFVQDPITLADAAEFGLQPLLIYGLSIPGTHLRWFAFSPADNPRSFISVLQEAWEKPGVLRGYPDILKISRHINEASPALIEQLRRYGVSVVVAGSDDKRLPASMRATQKCVLELSFHFKEGDSLIATMTDLNANALSYYEEQSTYAVLFAHQKTIRENTIQWLDLAHRSINLDLPESLDWLPGNWLSSWESGVPGSMERHFLKTQWMTWLITGEGSDIDSHNKDDIDDADIPDDDYVITSNDLSRYAAEKAKLLIDCWPKGSAQIANAIGVTVKQLNGYLSCRANMASRDESHLLSLLNIDYREDVVDFELTGSYVLIAQSPKKASDAYDEISHGGGLSFSIEVIPESGQADPSWRYLVFSACAGDPSIMMIQRGSKVAEKFDDKLFLNFEGIKKIPDAKYREIVSVCAQSCACTDLFSSLELMDQFVERNRDFFDQFRVAFLM